MTTDEDLPADETSEDAESLDDGPILIGRLCQVPPAGPRASESRPVTSGLIDVRAMAAAYQRETRAAEIAAPLLVVAEGSQPVVILETATPRDRGRSRMARAWRGAILFAFGGLAFAAVTVVARRTAPAVPEETRPSAVEQRLAIADGTSSTVAPRESAILGALTDAGEAPAAEAKPLETVVVDLPTTITEMTGAPAVTIAERQTTGATLAGVRLPIRPSNSEIANAIVDAHDDLARCRETFGTSGLVPIAIEVSPSGAITSVAVGLGSTGFRACIGDSVRRQRLPASRQGTTAKFPIVVR